MAVTMRTVSAPKVARAGVSRRSTVACKAMKVEFGQAAAAFAAATALVAGSANALTYDQIQGLTYREVKGSGVANTCPVIDAGTSDLKALKAGSYQIENFCMEPVSFLVKEESQFKNVDSDFVKARLLTRLTYTLDQMYGKLNVSSDGQAQLLEEDGIDFAATTVQLPGGERVPFLFTIKEFDGKGELDAIKGDFLVPSYRGATFIDPKGRGAVNGYESAIALQAAQDDDAIMKENIKTHKPLKGSAVFSVAKIDPESGEIAGVFESIQPSDTDMGAKAPKDVKIGGLWYAQLK
ncbi:hypothetical protein HYH03_006053 [Edaphochlamys debaryana]|uniref:33kDa oxygen evolving protein of photosystem II n=1 Tax=Edaphochlamys debaryana TaxID=47281 RepID=A0A835Y3H5_9CHLO|nr:hypothetical protein HYH03_006053 [Edaphochlamys debaryana]|eukprot:KAG2495812.1 hypothetical protein HYH03_006053 [Edaphochlamys debaryana]